MRFVIITVPPPALVREIDLWRRPWNQSVGTKEALRYPPHITLRTGLVCPDEQAAQVAEAFFSHAARGFGVMARTLGLFFSVYGDPGAERGMVGWSVGLSDGLLRLHQHLLAFTAWAKGPQGVYRPHLSLAYGDLSPSGVEVLKTGLEGQDPPVPNFSWMVDHVALYHEQPEGWVEWGRTSLNSPAP